MKSDYFRLAINSLSHRRMRSWLTMIGVFIGIAAVVSLISLGQGMQSAITNQFSKLGVDKLTVKTKGSVTGPPGIGNSIMLTKGDYNIVKHSRGVDEVTARLIEPITVEFNDKKRYTFIATIPEESSARNLALESMDFKFVSGHVLQNKAKWKVMMSEEYATNPKFNNKVLRVGDKIKINDQIVDIVGIFKKTGNPFLDNAFVMNENPVRDLLGVNEKYGIIIAKINDGADINQVSENVKKDLRSYRHVDEGREDFEVETPADVAKTFTTILDIVQAVLIGIAAISLLVGGIGIMNTMYTSVLERKREIGIMKAIGAKNSDVLFIFLIESGMLGLTGSIIGLLLGIGLSKLVELIATKSLGTMLIQAHFSSWLVIGALLFGFIVGAIAGTFPAIQASHLEPADALRG